jgi:hypothetical protein
MRPGLDFDTSDAERASSLLTRDDPAQRSTSMMTHDAEHRSRDYGVAVPISVQRCRFPERDVPEVVVRAVGAERVHE